MEGHFVSRLTLAPEMKIHTAGKISTYGAKIRGGEAVRRRK